MTIPTFEIPPVGPKQGKVWGSTRLLFAHYGVECHQINFTKGAYCSLHRHDHKWNRFVVLCGKMIVRIYLDENMTVIDETMIGVGQVTDVSPGVLHEFEGVEDGMALELYWVVLSSSDIDRKSKGGKRDEAGCR